LQLFGHLKTARSSLERLSPASCFEVEKPFQPPSHASAEEGLLYCKDIVNFARLGPVQVYFLRDSFPVAVLDGGKPFLLDRPFSGVESRRSSP